MNTYTYPEKIPQEQELLKKYSPTIAQILYNRNITKLEVAESFINPSWEHNNDPFALLDMEKSILRIKQAIDQNEKITIYADYDADGIPGSVVLKKLFEKINYPHVDIYIPHRHDEGYGIHVEALEKIKNSGTKLIISIDVGITAKEAGSWCQKNNIDLIITDHHLPLQDEQGDILPPAFAIINPKQQQCTYPDPMLCGCGVIFKLVQAFSQKYAADYQLHQGWEKWLLGLVGISTVSDLVPLKNENRIFAHFGMKVIQKICSTNNHFIGIKKLVWSSGINHNHLTEDDIGFNITPKINASSRMSHPQDAVAVLLAEDEIRATQSVDHLTKLNNERKKLTKKMTSEAISLVEEQVIGDVILVGKENWSAGILGLVASKLVEKYKKPAFVWSIEHGTVKGSCRSLDGIHLVEVMQKLPSKTLLGFGGHKEAGGFSLEKKNITKLHTELEKAVSEFKTENTETEKDILLIDAEISIDQIDTRFYQEIRKLAPFGIGNPKPLFLIKGINIEKMQGFGKDKNHLEIFLKNSFGKTIRAIRFFKTPADFPNLEIGKKADLLVHIEYSVFMGKHELRLQLVDVLSDNSHINTK